MPTTATTSKPRNASGTVAGSPPPASSGASLAAASDATPRSIDALDGKNVRELQSLIERAFAMLDGAADTQTAPAQPAGNPAAETQPVVAGPPAGSVVRSATTLGRRILKSMIALAAALVIGIVPLERLLTPASTEAFVNAPLLTLRAPIAGHLANQPLVVGATVARDATITRVEPADGNPSAAAIFAPSSGQIWDVLVSPGDRVAAGQDLLRIVSCSAASVTATVSETVYDSLAPGTPARFNFYGDDTFYDGTVANLLGHAAPGGDFALPPDTISADAFRVVVALPHLGASPNCTVGRRGEVVFGSANH